MHNGRRGHWPPRPLSLITPILRAQRIPIKPKKRIGRHPGTGGPRYCQPPGKSGCKTSAQTARVVFDEATSRGGDGGIGGVTGRRISCAVVARGAAFFA